MEKKIHLERILWDDYDHFTKLKVNKDQKSFVASNADSLIDAYFATTEDKLNVITLGIYYGKKPVGFLMFTYNCPWAVKYYSLPENYYYIWRFMIDKKYQGQGFGKEALRLAIEYIKTFPLGKSEGCWLSYEPENKVARSLYLKLGFVERLDLHKEDMEIPAVLKLYNDHLRKND